MIHFVDRRIRCNSCRNRLLGLANKALIVGVGVLSFHALCSQRESAVRLSFNPVSEIVHGLTC